MSILDQAITPRRPVQRNDDSAVSLLSLSMLISARRDSPLESTLPPFIPALRIDGQSLPQGKRITSASEEQELHLDVAVATHKKIDLVFQTQVFKLKRDMQKRSRDSASSSALRQNPVAEGIDETPAHSSTTVCGGPSRARTSAAGDQDHSRTPGGTKCK
jgi:hypothetical protein